MRRLAAAVWFMFATAAYAQGELLPLESHVQWVRSEGAYRLRTLPGKPDNVASPDAQARRAPDLKRQPSALSQALARAWRVDFIEDGIEGSREMLRQCQRETSVVLTTPFMRSDAQQAHCSRF